MTSPPGPVHLPATAWRRPDVRQALGDRNVSALLRFAQQHTGASQSRLAEAIGIGQGRLNELVNRRREVTSLEMFERIADGLNMPDSARMLLGLAPSGIRAAGAADDLVAAAGIVGRYYSVQADAARDIRQLVAGASALDILAVRGLGLWGLNDSLLRAAMTTPTRPGALLVRVLILDADSDAAARRAVEIGESPDGFAAGIRLAEHKLAELTLHPAISLEAYRYTALPVWRVISTDEISFVSTFDEGWEGHESPVCRVDVLSGASLHRGFRRAIDELVATSERFI
ncbi:helix-turn-helix domain-containing protein [Catenulispora acidiphila]|uniref:helix-turn-helix domain-containing protein n=1 Tax=Catenulispora acidiphila TaxID=304895 RepID=UPI001CBAAA62|nr:helix-turn-helix transcriptional regulator [Catenulispora acidiphila]